MIQVSKLIPHGQGLAPVLLKRATTVALDWDVRQKSRFAATDSAGRELGIFLPRGTLVRGGDVLVAEHGGRAASYTEAAGQAVMAPAEITVRVDLQRGSHGATVYTCDLSKEYVAINADYRS